MNNIKIGVTGGSGFVGQHFKNVAQARSYNVVLLPRQLFLGAKDGRALKDHLTGVSSLVHLAGLAHWHSRDANEQTSKFHEANVVFSKQVMQVAISSGIKKFVFLSSVKAVAERSTKDGKVGPVVIDESLEPAPEDSYGRSKLEAERALSHCAVDAGMGLIVLRPPLVYGVGQKGNMWRVVKAIENGMPLPFGAINNLRSLISVDNLCDAILAVIRNRTVSHGAYFLKDVDISTPDLCRCIARAHNRSPRLFHVPPPVLVAIARLFGKRNVAERLTGSLVVDGEAFKRDFGWEPQYKIEDVFAAVARASSQ